MGCVVYVCVGCVYIVGYVCSVCVYIVCGGFNKMKDGACVLKSWSFEQVPRLRFWMTSKLAIQGTLCGMLSSRPLGSWY